MDAVFHQYRFRRRHLVNDIPVNAFAAVFVRVEIGTLNLLKQTNINYLLYI